MFYLPSLEHNDFINKVFRSRGFVQYKNCRVIIYDSSANSGFTLPWQIRNILRLNTE